MTNDQVEGEREALHSGIANAFVEYEDVGFVTKWIVVAETVMSDGHRELHTRAGAMEGGGLVGVKTWESLGMLHDALLNAEDSSRNASVSVIEDDDDEDDE